MVYLEIKFYEDVEPERDFGLIKVASLAEAMIWLDVAEYRVEGWLCSDKPVNYPESDYKEFSKAENALYARIFKEK
jgi:hypothetical protein